MYPAFELFLSDEVQALIDHFAAALELRVTFFSIDGEELRRGLHMRNSDYCAIVQHELETLNACLQMDSVKRAEAVAKRGIIEYRCHAGLREAIAPIFIHDQLAGFMMSGQYRIDDEVPECMLRRCKNAGQKQRLSNAFYKLPKFQPEKLKNLLGLFSMLIDYIVVRELAVLQSDRLRREIDRYIDLHCTEDIRLPVMARKLGRSVSSISQFLRYNYQTSFKDLLIERRLKKAEEFWRANPNATVGETAFASGFADQFYFSRVFKKRRGIPPGEYRNKQAKKTPPKTNSKIT
ncbi:MAG: PocR ligand-binding domain-containing protein [Victivallales bacterium]|jgi:AraC-like DNA-binding protein/ligand-binding sensor protein|nr:PocR ligand-binding domain-containing protein [Victivallales bacterium]